MKKTNKTKKIYRKIIAFFVIMILCILVSFLNGDTEKDKIYNDSIDNTVYEEDTNVTNTVSNITDTTNNKDDNKNIIDINNIPPYNGNACIELNGGIPEFNETEFTTEPFEYYSDLDVKGRCGVAFANICKEIMPKENEKRGNISYDPSGWKGNQHEYPNLINTRYLYNRCHLIAWQLGDENNNEKNLITGTAYMNQAMIDWENDIADYIKANNDYHVLYRVTPIFEGDNLVASGVHMEAMAVEERERGICFNIYIYNVQPNIAIDYATGENYEKLLLTE